VPCVGRPTSTRNPTRALSHHVTYTSLVLSVCIMFGCMPPATLSRTEQSYLLDGLRSKPAERADRRGLHEYRMMQVDTDLSLQADGSARVVLGSTEVHCGVKAEIESYDAPHVNVSTDLEFAPWLPPSPRVQVMVEYSPALLHEHNATELAMITDTVQDMLQACYALTGNSIGPLDARQFIVVPYARYWVLHLDVYVMSWSGGNVLDAVFAAAFCAMYQARIPGTKILALDKAAARQDDEVDQDDPAGIKFITRGRKPSSSAAIDDAVDFALENEWDHGRLLSGREDVPVCISIYPFEDTYLLDPTLEEETALSSSIAVLASARGHIYGIRQRGSGELTLDAIHKAADVGASYAKQLAQTLQARFV